MHCLELSHYFANLNDRNSNIKNVFESDTVLHYVAQLHAFIRKFNMMRNMEWNGIKQENSIISPMLPSFFNLQSEQDESSPL